jgi:hypothetical protein
VECSSKGGKMHRYQSLELEHHLPNVHGKYPQKVGQGVRQLSPCWLIGEATVAWIEEGKKPTPKICQ